VSTTVAVGGALANKLDNGGEAWVRMSWVAGLRRLGFHVYFIEEIDERACTDAQGRAAEFEHSVQVSYFRQVIERFGLSRRAALVCDGGAKGAGLRYDELLERIDGAALLVNVSGHVRTARLLRPFRLRAYVDLDPGFTQIWHSEGLAGARLAGHDAFFTIGENIGTRACPIPTNGLRWLPTRQPVLVDDWPVSTTPGAMFTTVANWRGPYGPVHLKGVRYGSKVHEFRKLADLPLLTAERFELALAIESDDAADRALLTEHGWRVVHARSVSSQPDAFRTYVQESKAEFSCAQGVYVDTNSGWFSDRTTRYLASGLPAVVQDTGVARNLPVGEGLVTFRTLKQAAAAVAEVAADYPRHRKAARALALEAFDSDLVLGRFLEAVDVAP